MKDPGSDSGYLDIKALSVYSSFSPRTLRKILSQPGAPAFYRLPGPGKFLVKKSDFDSWLEQYKQQPADLDALINDTLAEFGAGR
jgi:hypothetical protein